MRYLLTGQETERLVFKPVSTDHFTQWLPFYLHPDSFRYWEGHRDDPETECRAWYENQFRRYENNLGGMNALFSKKSGKLVGHCGLLVQTVDQKQELEIGYSLLPEFWNQGLATEAAIRCRDFAFENHFAPSLISIISITNLPSQRVAMKLGMRAHDQTMYNQNPVFIFRISADEFTSPSL